MLRPRVALFFWSLIPLGRQSIAARRGCQSREKRKTIASKKVVVARESGRSSPSRLLDSITTASGILVPRFRGGDDRLHAKRSDDNYAGARKLISVRVL